MEERKRRAKNLFAECWEDSSIESSKVTGLELPQ